MQTKLTLRVDDRLVRQAKAYAHHRGKSVSGIVADYFARLGGEAAPANEPLSPAVRSLAGALAGRRISKDDYRRFLREKHRRGCCSTRTSFLTFCSNARRHLQTLLSLFEIAPVTRVVLTDALALGWSDLFTRSWRWVR